MTKYIIEKLFSEYNLIFPEFCLLYQIYSTCILTSVECERGFSLINRIKTEDRNKMKVPVLRNIVNIITNCKTHNDINYDKAYTF